MKSRAEFVSQSLFSHHTKSFCKLEILDNCLGRVSTPLSFSIFFNKKKIESLEWEALKFLFWVPFST
jgi:hypothetical protein